MDERVCSDQFPGQTQRACGNLAPRGILGREPQEVCCRDARRKDPRARRDKFPDRRRIWAAQTEGGRSTSEIDALAQPLDLAALGQPGERRGNGGKWQVTEVLQPPQPFAAALDALANDFRSARCGFGRGFHIPKYRYFWSARQVFLV